jgi:exonuclease V
MLYHRLLTNLASGTVDSKAIFSRYNLDPAVPFSNTFKNEIASLEQNFAPSTDADSNYVPLSSTTDALSELRLHDSLGALWDMMMQEFSRTIPTSDAVSSILRAEFRSQQDGTVLGSHCFTMDEKILEAYVNDEMKWWRGEREAKGVEVEEAFKCRVCEFAEECEWRQGKIEEEFEKRRLRRKSKINV